MIRATKITLNGLLYSIIAIYYLRSFDALSTPPFSTVGIPLENILSHLSTVQASILSVFIHALVAGLSVKCHGRTAMGRTFVGAVLMHFSMESYAQIAKLPYCSKYGLCEGKCIDKVFWGASVGGVLMRRLEERGWGGKVTWTSLLKSTKDWLLEEVDGAEEKPTEVSE